MKGAAKSKVAFFWFVKQYKNPEHIRYEDIEYTFRINQVAMTISKETKTFRLATPESHKRDRFLDKDTKKWIGSLPKEVIYYDGQDNTLIAFKSKEKDKIIKKLQSVIKEDEERQEEEDAKRQDR